MQIPVAGASPDDSTSVRRHLTHRGALGNARRVGLGSTRSTCATPRSSPWPSHVVVKQCGRSWPTAGRSATFMAKPFRSGRACPATCTLALERRRTTRSPTGDAAPFVGARWRTRRRDAAVRDHDQLVQALRSTVRGRHSMAWSEDNRTPIPSWARSARRSSAASGAGLQPYLASRPATAGLDASPTAPSRLPSSRRVYAATELPPCTAR